MENPSCYHDLPGVPGPEQDLYFFSAIGPIVFFYVAVWKAMRLLPNTFPPDLDHNARAITKTFWNICTGTKNTLAAFPGYRDTISPEHDFPAPTPKTKTAAKTKAKKKPKANTFSKTDHNTQRSENKDRIRATFN
jgi:hypothetical protein